MVKTHWRMDRESITCMGFHPLNQDVGRQQGFFWSALPMPLNGLVCLGLFVGLANSAAAQVIPEQKTQVRQCSTLASRSLEMSPTKNCDRPFTTDSLLPVAAAIQPGLPQTSLPDGHSAAKPLPETTLAHSRLQAQSETLPPETSSIASDLDIDPQIIEDSPVLQRWLEAIPDIAADVKYDPAFRTRLRVGYAQFPSAGQTGGIHIGIQDVFIGRTPLTVSAEYAASFRGDSELLGVDAQYYLLPLGWYGNVAPVVGYRSIETPDFDSAGINVGFRIILIPSRGGGADLSLTQTWVAPGTEDEVGITTFSAGYAVTPDLRIATDIQTQNASNNQESRVSILLEWMP